MTDKQKTILLFIGFGLIFITMLMFKPRTLSKEEYYNQVPKATNLKDFYLIYKMWTDEEYRSVENTQDSVDN